MEPDTKPKTTDELARFLISRAEMLLVDVDPWHSKYDWVTQRNCWITLAQEFWDSIKPNTEAETGVE
jgi:hypothetical protein